MRRPERSEVVPLWYGGVARYQDVAAYAGSNKLFFDCVLDLMSAENLSPAVLTEKVSPADSPIGA